MDEFLESYRIDELANINREIEELIRDKKLEDNFDNEDIKKICLDHYRYIEENHRGGDRKDLMNFKSTYSIKLVGKEKYHPSFKTFDEADKSVELDSPIDSFIIELTTTERYSEINLKLEVRKDSFRSIWIKSSPDDLQVMQELFGEFRFWAIQQIPKKWTSLWIKHGSAFGELVIIFSFITFAFYAKTTSNPYDLFLEIQKIINSGINDSNRNKAIEYLLRVSGGQPLTTTAVDYSQMIHALPTWLMIVAIGFSIRISPKKGLIGLNGDKIKVAKWKIWEKVLFGSVPLFILSKFASYIWSGIFTPHN